MKFTVKLFFIAILTTFLCMDHLFSQPEPKNQEQIEKERIEKEKFEAGKVVKILESLNAKTLVEAEKGKLCSREATNLLKNIKIDEKLVTALLKEMDKRFFRQKKPKTILPNDFSTWGDFALSIYSTSTDFKTFVKKLTGKDLKDLTRAQEMEIYSLFKEYEEDHYFWLYDHELKKSENECGNANLSFRVFPSDINYPNIEWKLVYKIWYDCTCDALSTANDLDLFNVKYLGDIKSVVTSKGIVFNMPTNVRGRNDLQCCGNDPTEEEAPRTELPKEDKKEKFATGHEPIGYQPADHNIGTGVGLGFEDNFRDISACLHFEYLYLLDLMEDVAAFMWFIGGDVEFGAIFSEFFKSQSIKVGPKFQLNKALPKVGKLQLVNGVKAQYGYTNQESSGFNTTIQGAFISLFTGFNFPIGKQLDLGMEIPIINVNYTATQPAFGPSQKDTDVSFLLNKDNLAKMLLRIRLGD